MTNRQRAGIVCMLAALGWQIIARDPSFGGISLVSIMLTSVMFGAGAYLTLYPWE